MYFFYELNFKFMINKDKFEILEKLLVWINYLLFFYDVSCINDFYL